MGKKWRHKEFVTCSRSQNKLIAVFAFCSFPCAGLFWGSSFLSPEVRSVCSLPTFSLDPCFWDATVGKEEMFLLWLLISAGHSSWQIWNKMETASASFPHTWAASLHLMWELGMEGRMASAVPFWVLLPTPLPSKAGKWTWNTRCKAPVSQAAVFLPHGLCLAPLQISHSPPLPIQQVYWGPTLWQAMYKGCWGCCRESPHNSYSQWVPSLVQVHPCPFPLYITTWI